MRAGRGGAARRRSSKLNQRFLSHARVSRLMKEITQPMTANLQKKLHKTLSASYPRIQLFLPECSQSNIADRAEESELAEMGQRGDGTEEDKEKQASGNGSIVCTLHAIRVASRGVARRGEGRALTLLM